MSKEIRFLLVFLIVALAVLVYLQNQQCSAIPNTGSLSAQNTQHFTTDNNNVQNDQLTSRLDSRLLNSRRQTLSKKDQMQDKTRSSKDSQKITSRIVDNILKNEKNNQAEYELDSMLEGEDMTQENSGNSMMENPLLLDVDRRRKTIPDSNPDQQVLDELIREVETGNDLQVNSPQDALFKKRSTSINSAKNGFRKVSYADSAYRMNFNGDGETNMSKESQEELNNMYEDALIFKNAEYTNNNNFKGMNDSNDQWGSADLQNFSSNSPQTQQEKIMNLYNSNNYLPNDKLLKPELAKGFQILENPVSVNNPSLIPVLKAIPVSSTLGSKRNSTWDIRAEPANPKMAISPFLNSSIQPDIYATQRGCL
jgi:hypothetical protein